MKIELENTGAFITAWADNGNVLVRCNIQYTDCRDDETLDSFIERHGGLMGTLEYLNRAYANKGQPAAVYTQLTREEIDMVFQEIAEMTHDFAPYDLLDYFGINQESDYGKRFMAACEKWKRLKR